MITPLDRSIGSLAAAARRAATVTATTGRAAAVTATTATSSAAAATTASTTGWCHPHGMVLAFAVIVCDLEGHAVSLLNAALPIQEAAGVDEQVRVAIVRFEETKSLVVIPPQHLSGASAAAAAAAATTTTTRARGAPSTTT